VGSDAQRLYQVRVFLEVPPPEIEAFADTVERLICSVDHDDSATRCPHRWFILTEELDTAEAAKWQDLLNE